LEILNLCNGSTFFFGGKQDVIEIVTLGSYWILEIITVWEVLLKPTLLDHRQNLCRIRSSALGPMIRYYRGNNWDPFGEALRNKLERWPYMKCN
jgi:hypothetical protein